jgi:hypothetical protein
MTDVYGLAVDGFFPHLQSLRIYVNNAVIKTVSTGLPTITSLHMPKLEVFDLYLKRRGEEDDGEEKVEWETVETLISYSVMPRLRRCSLIYALSTSDKVRRIFESSIFHNDKRNTRVQFGLYLSTSTSIDSSDSINICDIGFARYNKICVLYVSIFPFYLGK